MRSVSVILVLVLICKKLKPILCVIKIAVTESLHGVPNSEAEPRIVGGEAAPEYRYPYMVSLQKKTNNFCGGSLIATDLVLTAAHCVVGQSQSLLRVVSNTYNMSNTIDDKPFSIDNIVIHPLHQEIILSGTKVNIHDAAILRLNAPSSQNIVFLNSNQTLPQPKSDLEVMGWGWTNNAGGRPEVLQEVTVEAISLEECITYYPAMQGRLTPDMLCAASPGKDSCGGDSGGPLIIQGANYSQDVQVGVVSWGSSTCASKFFAGVYNNVAEEFDWIRFMACTLSYDPPTYFDCNNVGTWSPQPSSYPTAPTNSPAPSLQSLSPSSNIIFIPSSAHVTLTRTVWYYVVGVVFLCSFMIL